jgi:hypothetical protein
METKHTPGPWFVAPPKYGDRQIRSKSCEHDIAHVDYRVGDDVMEANTCLIAAAPVLLEACEVLASLASEKSSHSDSHQRFKKALALAARAVKKAKGE